MLEHEAHLDGGDETRGGLSVTDVCFVRSDIQRIIRSALRAKGLDDAVQLVRVASLRTSAVCFYRRYVARICVGPEK